MAVSSSPNTFDNLNGLFKDTYADNLENLLPKGLVVQQDLKWADKSKMPGNRFHQPVLLGHEHGFTYAGGAATGKNNTVASAGAFEISGAVPGRTTDATIFGTQMLLRSQIDYESAARASSGGKRAFRRTLDIVVENMFQSSRKRMEIDYLYGNVGLAQIATSTVVATTTNQWTITILAANWAAGFWAGMENAVVQVFDNDGAAADPGGLLGPDTFRQNYIVQSVDLNQSGTSYTIVLRNAVSGNTTAPVASDFIFFEAQGSAPMGALSGGGGAYANRVFDGLVKCMSRTEGDELFDIPITGNSLWAPNQKAAGGPLTYELITDAIAEIVAKGLDEDLKLYVCPKVWADLVQQEDKYKTFTGTGATTGGGSLASKVIYSAGTGDRTIGSSGISFVTQAGTITVTPSNYVKEEHGICIAPRLWKRVGATDLTFRLPDRGDEFFLHLTEKAGYELRAYVNHALFTKAPAKSLLLTGLTS